MSDKLCKKCGFKITNAKSIHQEYCNDCHKNLKGGLSRMTPEQKEYNKRLQNKMGKDKTTKTQTQTEEPVTSVETNTYTICSKCGAKKMCRKDIYLKRVQKFGSVAELEKNYVCRDCKKKE